MSERRIGIPIVPFRRPRENDLKAQVHYHTRRSDGFGTPEQLVEGALEVGINLLIPTDHDRISGAVEALEIAERKRYINKSNTKDHFEIRIGEEVSTKEGHVLVLGVKESIRCNLHAQETAEMARDQGALVVIPHPGFSQADGISWELTDHLVELGLVDGVEMWNGAQESLTYMASIFSVFPGGNWLAKKLMLEDDINIEAIRRFRNSGGNAYAAIGGHDGHLATASSLAKVVTLFPEGMDFFDAVRQKKTAASTQFQPEFWGILMYLAQGKLSTKLEEDRKNGNGIMCAL
jgi:hypothetical protein